MSKFMNLRIRFIPNESRTIPERIPKKSRRKNIRRKKVTVKYSLHIFGGYVIPAIPSKYEYKLILAFTCA